MPISNERISAEIRAIAAFTETPGEGATRQISSSAWNQARDYLAAQLQSIGCNIRKEEDGTIRARPAAIGWDAPVWLCGSHLAAADRAGDYDGVIGAVLPLEVMRAAIEDLKVALPLELAIWSDAVATAHRSTIGFIEVRVDPGPVLWDAGEAVALVTKIAGRREYRCTLLGAGGSAGAVPIANRRDALAAAAELIGEIDKIAHELGGSCLITVTGIDARPNSPGAICARAELTIEVSSGATDALARADAAIQRATPDLAAAARGIESQIAVVDSLAALDLDASICAKIARVAAKILDGRAIRKISTGTALTAAILGAQVPSAAIFVAAREGVHHHPNEFCRAGDLVLAAKILFDTVRDRRME